MKIMDNNHKNDSSNNNQKSAIRNEDEVQTKRNDQLLNKPNSNNNTINNIKRKRDHSAPVISKSLSNDPNTNSVSSLYKHTSSSTNNFRSASNDRIDHSAPDYSETKNKKQGLFMVMKIIDKYLSKLYYYRKFEEKLVVF